MGESHRERIRFLSKIDKWRRYYGAPDPVSINWAVQHPLKGNDGGTAYRYINWGTPPGPWLEVFRDFGEASVLYPLAGQSSPRFEEIQELALLYKELFQSMEGKNDFYFDRCVAQGSCA